jgi:hypothetical protein
VVLTKHIKPTWARASVHQNHRQRVLGLLSAAETEAAGQTKTELLEAEFEVGVEEVYFIICLTQLL